MPRKLVYLAVPYSHEDPEVRAYRFSEVNKQACRLMNEGYIVYSPISHGHAIALSGDLPVTWDYWEESCIAYLSYSHKLVVLCLDGWEESQGVQAEITIAKSMNITLEYLKVK